MAWTRVPEGRQGKSGPEKRTGAQEKALRIPYFGRDGPSHFESVTLMLKMQSPPTLLAVWVRPRTHSLDVMQIAPQGEKVSYKGRAAITSAGVTVYIVPRGHSGLDSN
jgi:hypothetical protein